VTIANSGQVFNAHTYIGVYDISRSNKLVVTDPGSLLTSTGNVYVGSGGAGNSLVVSNGGRVASGRILMGVNSAAASNNTLLVTGQGSRWDNTGFAGDLNIYLGFAAASNSITVANGASLTNTGGTTYIGYGGTGLNQLVITNGGKVNSLNTYLGDASTSVGNTALMRDDGSLLSDVNLVIGNAGGGNQVTVASSGQVFNAYTLLG